MRAGTTSRICRKTEVTATNVAPRAASPKYPAPTLHRCGVAQGRRGISVKDANFTKVITVTD